MSDLDERDDFMEEDDYYMEGIDGDEVVDLGEDI